MLLLLLATIGAAVPALSHQLAGNENYAYEARNSLRRSTSKRAAATEFDPKAITFSVGDKQFISPTGAEFKTYNVKGNWGLESYAGKTIPITVIPVNGEVTCSLLQSKVDKYKEADDVWDEVSRDRVGVLTIVLPCKRHVHYYLFVPCDQ